MMNDPAVVGVSEGACPNADRLSFFVGAGARLRFAREELKGAAFTLNARVIVDVFREQARSYIGRRRLTDRHWGMPVQ